MDKRESAFLTASRLPTNKNDGVKKSTDTKATVSKFDE